MACACHGPGLRLDLMVIFAEEVGGGLWGEQGDRGGTARVSKRFRL